LWQGTDGRRGQRERSRIKLIAMTALSPLSIGGLQLESPVLLAPMAGYTDLPFRLTVRRLGGLGLAYSEMLSPHSILQGRGKRRKEMLATNPEDKPLGYQLYGTDAGMMADAARWLQEQGAVVIDINMGCPKRRIACAGPGAGLLRNPLEAVRLAERVVEAVSIPVTAKLRLGWDSRTFVAGDLARDLERAGVAAITIHGRTADQGYRGEVDLDGIRRVAESVVSVPVIGNGDIDSPAAALEMVEVTGCAGVMLGRGLTKDPWLARDISRALAGLPALPPPSLSERWQEFRDLLERTAGHHGEEKAAILFRKWIPPWASRLKIGREGLLSLLKIPDLQTLRMALEELEPDEGDAP